MEKYNNKLENGDYSKQHHKKYDKLIQVNGESVPLSFNFFRENLSASQSNTEQEFNKQPIMRWRIMNGSTILNICAIILALSCIFLEIFELPKVFNNSRNIEILKRDLEILQRQFYQANFLKELKAFENQLYDDGNEDDATDVDETDDEKTLTDNFMYLRYKRYTDSNQSLNDTKNKNLENLRDSRVDELKNTASEHKRRHYRKVPDEVKKSLIPRESNKRSLRAARQMFAAHYGADSSLFTEENEHTGNGRYKHSEGIFKAWRPSEWMDDLGMERHFLLNNDGKLTITEAGLYLIYAQIHYLDEHDENGYHLLVNGRPILQCMVYSPGVGHKSRSCFSAQVTLLQNNDRIILRDIGVSRYTLFQKDKSFFGLVKIGDIKHPQVQPSQLTETEVT